MGRSTRSVQKDRMSQAKLDSLIIRKPVESDRPIFTNHLEYDTLRPDVVIQNFCASIKDMLARYNYDKEQYSKLENEMQDVLHYVEMDSDKNANTGYKIYKKLAEVRRERRMCKNELDLLQPIYDAFNGTTTLSYLGNVLGSVRTARSMIDNRAYTVRTDVLDPFLEK